MADPIPPKGKYRSDQSGEQPQTLLVIHVMTPGVIQIPGDVSVGEAARLMHREQVPCLLIKDTDSQMGIVTHSDIVFKVVAQGLNPDDIDARRVMSRPVQTIEFDQPLEEVSQALYSSEIPFLIVTKQHHPVGILTPQDLLGTAKFCPAQIPATIRVYSQKPDGVAHEALLTQLSHRGAFVECRAAMQPGSRVTLEFALPSSTKPLAIESTVLDYAPPPSDTTGLTASPLGGIPLQFTDISLSKQLQISTWVTQLKNKRTGHS